MEKVRSIEIKEELRILKNKANLQICGKNI